MKESKLPKRGMWASGNYCCKCSDCGDEYMGDRRSQICADCAYKQPSTAELIASLRSEKHRSQMKGYIYIYLPALLDRAADRLEAAEQRDVDAVYWEKEWVKIDNMLTETNTRLRKALPELLDMVEGYVKHAAHCWSTNPPYEDPCNCGLDELLRNMSND